MIPHPAGKLISLLFQLIQQLFHLSGLLCQLRAGHGSGVGVGINQAQLLKLRGRLVPLHQAGDLLPLFRFILCQQLDRCPAPVPGNHHVPPAIDGAHKDGLLQSAQLDICRQLLDARQTVEIVRVWVDQLPLYVRTLDY